VEGRVVDPEGHALAGIPVYVALADPKGYERADQQILFTRGPDSDGGLAEARRYGEYARTTATGAFRLDAEFTRRISSGDGGVRVAIANPAWVESKIASGEEGGEVHANPRSPSRSAWWTTPARPFPSFALSSASPLATETTESPPRTAASSCSGGVGKICRRR